MKQIFDYDLCVIGGGINGCGIARDAAGRGLKVLLLEKGDLACATSSASSKLIHGGLRYLEFHEYRLVREALKERKVLLDAAPHIIWPMDFILPHHKDLRPLWMIRCGLFLYDWLGWPKNLRGSKMLRFDRHKSGERLKKIYFRGFRYSDCWVQDSRLVLANAQDAAAHGAVIFTHTRCDGLKVQEDGLWQVVYSCDQGEHHNVTVRSVVNAAGPWVGSFLQSAGLDADENGVPQVRLVKGSHMIVPKQYDGDHAYILQQKDGRIVFVLPYENHFNLIGTTEEDFEGDPMEAHISSEETAYLLRAFNDSFDPQITARDIVHSYSGVRPLYDDGQDDAKAVTREYKFHVHDTAAPMVSVYGGKLTTYRKLSENAVNKILRLLGEDGEPWSADSKLPGAQELFANHDELLQFYCARYDFLPRELLLRFVKNYGDLAQQFLKDARTTDDLGVHYGDGVYEAEIDYMIAHEWVRSAEDALWRRSKLLLHISDDTKANIAAAIDDKVNNMK